jgi:hypothetical protein
MADCRRFSKIVRNAPRGASGVFFVTNFMLVKHFSKSGHAKTGDNHRGWNILLPYMILEARFVAGKDWIATTTSDAGAKERLHPTWSRNDGVGRTGAYVAGCPLALE